MSLLTAGFAKLATTQALVDAEVLRISATVARAWDPAACGSLERSLTS